MHRTPLHSLLVLAVGMLMLAQYVPTEHLHEGRHDHCVHCNGSYCTMEGCDCGHAHRPHDEPARHMHRPHDAVARHAHPAQGNAAGDADAAREDAAPDAHPPHGEAPGHDAHERHAAKHSGADDGADDIRYDVFVKPCGSTPAALLLPTLDKFVLSGWPLREPVGRDVPAGAADVPFHHQRLVDDIFRPPIPDIA